MKLNPQIQGWFIRYFLEHPEARPAKAIVDSPVNIFEGSYEVIPDEIEEVKRMVNDKRDVFNTIQNVMNKDQLKRYIQMNNPELAEKENLDDMPKDKLILEATLIAATLTV